MRLIEGRSRIQKVARFSTLALVVALGNSATAFAFGCKAHLFEQASGDPIVAGSIELPSASADLYVYVKSVRGQVLQVIPILLDPIAGPLDIPIRRGSFSAVAEFDAYGPSGFGAAIADAAGRVLCRTDFPALTHSTLCKAGFYLQADGQMHVAGSISSLPPASWVAIADATGLTRQMIQLRNDPVSDSVALKDDGTLAAPQPIVAYFDEALSFQLDAQMSYTASFLADLDAPLCVSSVLKPVAPSSVIGVSATVHPAGGLTGGLSSAASSLSAAAVRRSQVAAANGGSASDMRSR